MGRPWGGGAGAGALFRKKEVNDDKSFTCAAPPKASLWRQGVKLPPDHGLLGSTCRPVPRDTRYGALGELQGAITIIFVTIVTVLYFSQWVLTHVYTLLKP